MFNFIKYIFYSFCGFILNAFIFMLFGAFVAFFMLALGMAEMPVVKESSPLLAEFLDSSEKTKNFSFKEINEGVAHLIFKCAREDSVKLKRPVTMPVAPVFSADGKYLRACVPFSANLFGQFITMGAFVSLDVNEGDVNVKSGRVGNARLPAFVAEKMAESLFGFYEPIKSLRGYCDILEDSNIMVLHTGDVRIEKK